MSRSVTSGATIHTRPGTRRARIAALSRTIPGVIARTTQTPASIRALVKVQTPVSVRASVSVRLVARPGARPILIRTATVRVSVRSLPASRGAIASALSECHRKRHSDPDPERHPDRDVVHRHTEGSPHGHSEPDPQAPVRLDGPAAIRFVTLGHAHDVSPVQRRRPPPNDGSTPPAEDFPRCRNLECPRDLSGSFAGIRASGDNRSLAPHASVIAHFPCARFALIRGRSSAMHRRRLTRALRESRQPRDSVAPVRYDQGALFARSGEAGEVRRRVRVLALTRRRSPPPSGFFL